MVYHNFFFQNAGVDLERAVTRYSRCRRRDPEQEHHESNEDVYVSKKKFHQVLEYKKKLTFFTIIIAFQVSLL